MSTVRAEVAQEIDDAEVEHKDALAAYFSALSKIVDLGTLEGGARGFDFYVKVPAHEMHEKTQRIVDIEFDIDGRFGVHFRTYAIATDSAAGS